MLHHHVFDFVRIDVETGNEDHVFLAIDDTQKTFVIHHRDVAGVQPAVFDDLIRGIWALPVAQHHLRPSDAQLARFAVRHFVTLIVHQFSFRRRDRQTDTAAVVVDVMRVDADQRGALRQTIAFQQILSGEFYPALGNRLLNRHPAARRKMQRGEIELLELFIVKQRVKQGVHAGHGGERVFRQLFNQPRNVARVGDQYVLTAKLDKQQAVHGQRKNVIQRKRGDHKLLARVQQWPVGGVHLFKVRQHITMGQHRPFSHAGGTAGVLQERQIF